MRVFNYINDYSMIPSTIKGYIEELVKELKLLIELEQHPYYEKALNYVLEFKNKYPNFSKISSSILDDLLKSENVEYCYINKKYPPNASKTGLEFEHDLKEIFELEEKLSKLSFSITCNSVTKYEDIVNGEPFMIFAHATDYLPGTPDMRNYHKGGHRYLSCSLLTNNELNTFNNCKIAYVYTPTENNLILSCYFDSATGTFYHPGFHTVKEIKTNNKIEYISAGYIQDDARAVTKISTPKVVEKLSIERELETQPELFDYENCLTNETVLDRDNSKCSGAVLISNGCDLLIYEYIHLKKNNIKFKCINKGLYREQHNLKPYTVKEYEDFLYKLDKLPSLINMYELTNEDLLAYYNEVIIPMKYNEEIMTILDNYFSKYIDTKKRTL